MLDRIINKISGIEQTLILIDGLKDDCRKKFISDPVYKGALLHYLYVLSDKVITLAEMVIKFKGFRSAENYHENIDILGENGVIPGEFAYDFAKIASFRNFLAHDYDRVDYLVICEQILDKITDVEKYIGFIKNYLGIK